jgi:hypothetical protein
MLVKLTGWERLFTNGAGGHNKSTASSLSRPACESVPATDMAVSTMLSTVAGSTARSILLKALRLGADNLTLCMKT